MWQSEAQQHQVIRGLLARVHIEHLWTAEGPTEEAVGLLRDKGGPMSHGQTVMLQVAFDLWNGGGKAMLDDLIGVLDDGNLRAVLDAVAVVRPGVR